MRSRRKQEERGRMASGKKEESDGLYGKRLPPRRRDRALGRPHVLQNHITSDAFALRSTSVADRIIPAAASISSSVAFLMRSSSTSRPSAGVRHHSAHTSKFSAHGGLDVGDDLARCGDGHGRGAAARSLSRFRLAQYEYRAPTINSPGKTPALNAVVWTLDGMTPSSQNTSPNIRLPRDNRHDRHHPRSRRAFFTTDECTKGRYASENFPLLNAYAG